MKFHDREAVQIENNQIRVTVLREGGHIAELLHKASGVNPLWIPHWKTIEPSAYDPALDQEYGANEESALLAGIMGHNLCLDIFGPPSTEEAEAGMPVHGPLSTARCNIESSESEIRVSAQLPISALRFERIIRLDDLTPGVQISESVENLLAMDRPLAWTQHITIGAPFLEHGVTRFDLHSQASKVFGPPAFGNSDLVAGADFTWPNAPTRGGAAVDLSVFTSESVSARFTTHLMSPTPEQVSFTAFNPRLDLGLTYRWNRNDFPWLGIWEENRSRTGAPWNGKTVACGLEFGASPFPEIRRTMIERNKLFDTPTFRWFPAKSRLTAAYSASVKWVGELG